ncbi:hypothetical protein J32TS6_11230 [Virgibacillus pantothenticus]|uniref:Transcriptional regulator n=1 Tax=Virgibacillus pantothenticus TaxID=1473 RepID=A0A0L0QLS4_VIRPA|nr:MULTISPECIES: MurR/RpiR family transcriptional regulator [Virgibacillus]API93285.1 hypothetical protein BKP57_16560 [Virgibacillus sp. 6R]KNE19560.1 hypothetical protein AFK71_13875 [Virgibacillus pantothenticus]MBS7428669.1 MurR/RpiR family transcriptional regulator [Virgibacillus sp. 19R1-5]MBU8565803.1 MurR/RpiR family transcriptional regulator [Virgibacillus pantothenticus]MBU8599611.1 MurR/RpiR family transcriptional regulator [Virgibacillus pantothenticus]
MKKLIHEKYDQLSEAQRKVARYMLKNMEEVVVLSAQKIATLSDVSEATVHRFAQTLGYSSFIELKQAIHATVRNNQRALNNLLTTTAEKPDSWLEKHFLQEADNIAYTSKTVKESDIQAAAEKLLQARHIWIAGWRLGLSITTYMRFVFSYMLGNSTLIPQGEAAEYSAHFKKADVLIASVFPRYDRKTLQIIKLAKDKEVQIIILTDSSLCPACKYADITLFVRTKSKGFLDSYTAALSVCQAIVNEISYLGGDRIKENIKQIEAYYPAFLEKSES